MRTGAGQNASGRRKVFSEVGNMYGKRQEFYEGGVVSFYFTNFPSSLGVEDLWRVFMGWGKVVDVFIPKKKNKEGKSFGFVRFKGVAYPLELEKRLDQLWIGSYKMKVNSNRFVRRMEGHRRWRPEEIS